MLKVSVLKNAKINLAKSNEIETEALVAQILYEIKYEFFYNISGYKNYINLYN
jgi:hypothetical protein